MADAVIEQPTTTTPEAAPAAVPAAPATSAPATTPTTSERPTSFRQALERVATATEKPPATEQATAATVPIASATPAEVKSPTPQGPIPFADHQRIIENTRAKTRAEVTQEFDRQFGWARQVPRQDFEQIANLAQRLHADPIAFHRWLGEQIQAHPTYGLQFSAGRTTNTEPQPDVEVHDANGRVIAMTYSDKRLAEREAWHANRMRSEFSQQIEPLRTAHQQAQDRARIAEQDRQINAQSDTVMGRIDKILDGRTKELGSKVNDLLLADPNLDPIDAAFKVRETVITPEVQSKAVAEAEAIQKKKALGNTANGNGAVAAPAVRPKNPKELAKYLAGLDGARAN